MRQICILLFILGFSANASANEVQTALTLEEAVPQALARSGVPSLSLARIAQGKVVLVKAWGDAAPGQSANPSTLYNVASLTKPITAETVLRLVGTGELGLDAPLAEFWTDPDVAGDPNHLRLTMRHGLSHQSGFANWRRQTGGTLKFTFAPGTKVRYSGEGYMYVARYAERKLGQPLDMLAQRMVFAPLGMRETSYTGQPWFTGRIAHPNRDGTWLNPFIANRPVAADDLYTTAADYARFLVSVIGNEGMPDALARDRRTVQAQQSAPSCPKRPSSHCPVRVGFGLGWQVIEFKDKTFLMHTGNDQGEFTLAYWSPETREGAVVLTNSNNGGEAILAIIDQLSIDPDFASYLRTSAGR